MEADLRHLSSSEDNSLDTFYQKSKEYFLSLSKSLQIIISASVLVVIIILAFVAYYCCKKKPRASKQSPVKSQIIEIQEKPVQNESQQKMMPSDEALKELEELEKPE